MDNFLISQTTKDERKEIIKKALGLSLLGNKMPSDKILNMAKEYIEGNIELDEIQKRVLQKYNIKRDKNK